MTRRQWIREIRRLELIHDEVVMCRDSSAMTRICDGCGLVHSLTVHRSLITPTPNEVQVLYRPAAISCCGYAHVIRRIPWLDNSNDDPDYRYAFLLEVYREERGDR